MYYFYLISPLCPSLNDLVTELAVLRYFCICRVLCRCEVTITVLWYFSRTVFYRSSASSGLSRASRRSREPDTGRAAGDQHHSRPSVAMLSPESRSCYGLLFSSLSLSLSLSESADQRTRARTQGTSRERARITQTTCSS